jgi:hypothetical protein
VDKSNDPPPPTPLQDLPQAGEDYSLVLVAPGLGLQASSGPLAVASSPATALTFAVVSLSEPGPDR